MTVTSPTISEIARRAGVSKGTVSRILNGKNKENRPTIAKRAQRVRQIADELGYRPNAAARSIFSGRFRAAAFITCSDLGVDYFPRLLLHGIHAGLQAIDYRLVVSEVPASAFEDPSYVPHMMQESTVDGVLVYPTSHLNEHVIPYFEQQRQPVVWLNLNREFRSVYPDDFHGAALAVDYLASRGHKRIGYLSRPTVAGRSHFSEDDRRAGWAAAMKQRGLSPKRTRIYHTADGIDGSEGAAEHLLDDFPDLTAVVCYEQEEAVTLYAAALRRHKRVPEDLAIIGFHEGELRAMTGLRIPTVIVPFADVGREAVLMLNTLLDAGNRSAMDVPSVVIPYTDVKD